MANKANEYIMEIDSTAFANAVGQLDEALSLVASPRIQYIPAFIAEARFLLTRLNESGKRSDETFQPADAFMESDLPYKIRVIDLPAAQEPFKSIISRDMKPLPPL